MTRRISVLMALLLCAGCGPKRLDCFGHGVGPLPQPVDTTRSEGMDKTPTRALMATHDPGDRVQLPGGYWLEKQDDNGWWLGHEETGDTATKLVPSVPVGPGGSIDATIDEFAAAMNRLPSPATSGPSPTCVRCGAPEWAHPPVNFWNSEWHGGVVRVCPTGTFAVAADRAYYRPMPIGTACARCRYDKAEHREDGDKLWCPTAKFTYLQEGR